MKKLQVVHVEDAGVVVAQVGKRLGVSEDETWKAFDELVVAGYAEICTLPDHRQQPCWIIANIRGAFRTARKYS